MKGLKGNDYYRHMRKEYGEHLAEMQALGKGERNHLKDPSENMYKRDWLAKPPEKAQTLRKNMLGK